MKPRDIFLPGLMSIWKLIKILTFTDTSVKTRNANQFVMRTVFHTLSQYPGSPLKICSVKPLLGEKSLNFLPPRCILHNLVQPRENVE